MKNSVYGKFTALFAAVLICAAVAPLSLAQTRAQRRTIEPGAVMLPEKITVSAASLTDAIKVEPTPSATPTQDASDSPAAIDSPVPTATPVPTPDPMEGIVSFSGFPSGDTGAGADYSYQSDGLRIAVTKYQKEKLIYHVADIWVRDVSHFRTAFSGGRFKGRRQKLLDMAIGNSAILATNGDFYSARSSGIIIRNGVLYREKPRQDVCILFKNGELAVYGRDQITGAQAVSMGAWQSWAFGPTLLSGGAPIAKFSSEISRANPRTALGYYEPGHYCLVVVDGRSKSSRGLTLAELSQLMSDLGCARAYNLDGGMTSGMVYEGAILGSPAGGGRTSGDIICLK